ncbi:hypothetical protein [Palleronia sp.]|uniref:hypothetical protein n=1 Tax=Palleronia sp. TaxID=1940284 RepID=UPI0035C7B1AA
MVPRTLPFALLFAIIHLGIGHLTLLERAPRSRWLCASGGAAMAYVFLHIRPELASYEHTFIEQLSASRETAESLVYLVAFAGLAGFYGLERALAAAQPQAPGRTPRRRYLIAAYRQFCRL